MATRFWVGGTGTWDASDTTHWAAGSNGAGGQTVPVAGDAVTFDALSGGGTVTVNTTVNLFSLTMGAFTGTLDFSVNNNAVNITSQFVATGSGVRTLKMGDGTWTFSGTGLLTIWNCTTPTNFTLTAGSSTIVLSGTSATNRTFAGGGLTYNNLTIGTNPSAGLWIFSGANTFNTVSITGPNDIELVASVTQTISTLSFATSAGSGVVFQSQSRGTAATISIASGSPTFDYAAIRDITATGGATFTATNSVNLDGNTGITFSAGSSTGLPASRVSLGM